jgi:hypothetical protein
LCIARKVALGHQMLKQEASNPRANQGFVIHEAFSNGA